MSALSVGVGVGLGSRRRGGQLRGAARAAAARGSAWPSWRRS